MPDRERESEADSSIVKFRVNAADLISRQTKDREIDIDREIDQRETDRLKMQG